MSDFLRDLSDIWTGLQNMPFEFWWFCGVAALVLICGVALCAASTPPRNW